MAKKEINIPDKAKDIEVPAAIQNLEICDVVIHDEIIAAISGESSSDAECDNNSEYSVQQLFNLIDDSEDLIDNIYLKMQAALIHKESDKLYSFRTRNSSWQDYATLYKLQMDLHLSRKETNEVISGFKTICKRHEYSLSLPNDSRYIKDAVCSDLEQEFPIQDYKLVSTSDFFVVEDINLACGVYIDIFLKIAQQLLEATDENFHLRPLEEVNSSGDKIISVPASSCNFTKCYEHIQQVKGPDCYPLLIMVSGDGLYLNKTFSRAATPWYVHLAHWSKEEFYKPCHIDCVAYSPQYSISDEEIKGYMHERYSNTKKGEILRRIKYKNDLDFVCTLLEPILKYREEGINMQFWQEW
ncbi:MAG: hypothetical protein RL493_921 [Pseudomonadota bacterium]